MKRAISLILVLTFLSFTTTAWAGGKEPTIEELMREIRGLKNRVTKLEKKLGKQDEQLSSQKAELKKQEKHIDTHILHKEGILIRGAMSEGKDYHRWKRVVPIVGR